jgi:hypothetical protein
MITLEHDDFVTAVSKLWDDCSPLIRGKEKQIELATTIMEVFDRIGVSSDVFQEVITNIGSDNNFHTAYENLYGVDEYGLTEVGIDEDADEEMYGYGEY